MAIFDSEAFKDYLESVVNQLSEAECEQILDDIEFEIEQQTGPREIIKKILRWISDQFS